MIFLPKRCILCLSCPPAVKLSIYFCVKENQWCCTFLRDLIKDALLRDRKSKKPATQQESNPQSQEFCFASMGSTAVLQLLLFPSMMIH